MYKNVFRVCVKLQSALFSLEQSEIYECIGEFR
jgi:hypothetical protein